MEINYSVGPRYIDGINIDADVSASVPKVVTEQEISDPITGLSGLGYEPGQENRDGSPM